MEGLRRKLALGQDDLHEGLFETDEKQYAYQMPYVVESVVEPTIQKEQYNMEVIEHNGQFVIDSREVAEMVGKRHDHVMRDIKTIIEHLGGQPKIGDTYFIESEYTDVQGKKRTCYQITKKGCELFATRMTGAKGTQFAVTYIEKFNQMEGQLKSQTPIHSYVITDPIKRAEQWIEEGTG